MPAILDSTFAPEIFYEHTFGDISAAHRLNFLVAGWHNIHVSVMEGSLFTKTESGLFGRHMKRSISHIDFCANFFYDFTKTATEGDKRKIYFLLKPNHYFVQCGTVSLLPQV